MFNPSPRIQALRIDDRRSCYVVDDLLLEPGRLVDYAQTHRDAFRAAPFNAYPGIELLMPDEFSGLLDHFFRAHLIAPLGARRSLRRYSRLSMVTLSPQELQPAQWLCHCDRLAPDPAQASLASVLYLFQDPALGGTSFYRPRRGPRDTAQLTRDSGLLPAAAFARRYGVQPGYMLGSNDWFEHVLRVPARWNRGIFYDGDTFHSGDIAAPERMNADPRSGRLSLNAFFICSRPAA